MAGPALPAAHHPGMVTLPRSAGPEDIAARRFSPPTARHELLETRIETRLRADDTLYRHVEPGFSCISPMVGVGQNNRSLVDVEREVVVLPRASHRHPGLAVNTEAMQPAV